MKRIISSVLLANLALSPMGHSSSQLNQAWGIKGQFGVDGLTAQKLMTRKCSNSEVVVAVIDTGLDVTHPSLKNSLGSDLNKLIIIPITFATHGNQKDTTL